MSLLPVIFSKRNYKNDKKSAIVSGEISSPRKGELVDIDFRIWDSNWNWIQYLIEVLNSRIPKPPIRNIVQFYKSDKFCLFQGVKIGFWSLNKGSTE